MQEGWRKVEVTGSTGHHNLLWNRIGSARIAPPKTLTDPYTQLLPKVQSYLNSKTRTPNSKLFFDTLPNYTLF